MKRIEFPVREKLCLSVFDELEICGRIFCGRDAALPRLVQLYQEGRLAEAGIDLAGSVIFHTAVSPAGIGPTSSNKLEIEASIKTLSEAGVAVHLGKGTLSHDTMDALQRYGSCFAVTPPVSALFASRISGQRVAAFPELGMEAFHELKVDGIPAIVAISDGVSIFDQVKK